MPQLPRPRGRGTVRPEDTRTRARTPSPNTRIDSSSLPRIIGPCVPGGIIEYQSSGKHNSKRPPGSRSNFKTLDDGCAGPRFVRLTYNLFPRLLKDAGDTSVSLAALIQPLAQVGPEDLEVPLVDFGEGKPIPRCEHCLCYVNHYCTFHDQGNKWKCSVCGGMNRTPAHYVHGTDGRGHRLDHDEAPELRYGSIDIVAPPLAEGAKPKEPNFLFVLDTSMSSHASGFLSTMIEGILAAIDVAFPIGTSAKTKIGFVTYDRAVQVITSDGIFVMNNLDNPFLPVPPEKILVPVSDADKLEALLSHLDLTLLAAENKKLRSDPKVHACGLGSAMFVAEQIMSPNGGRVLFNIMHLPTVGVGKLKNRDNQNLYGKDDEKKLLKSETAWYRDLTDRCVEKSISFDLFFGAAKYCDLVTLSEVSHLTGGSIFHYPNFNLEKDAFQCRGDLEKCLTREFGMDAYAVVRCSPGATLSECFGGFSLNHQYQEFRFAQVNSDTTFLVTFEPQEDLPINPFVIQIAMLYTPKDGIPLIRLHTICRKNSVVMADIFRQTDLEAVMAASCKLTVQTILNPFSEHSIHKSLSQLIDGCVNVLYAYRKTCAPKSKRGQLILPETLKLMPLYTLSLLKHPSLAPTRSIDERVAFLRFLSIAPCSSTLTCMYPNLYDVSSNIEGIGFIDDRGYYQWPIWKPLGNASLRNDGIFVMNTGRQIFVCVGPNVSDEIFDSVFYEEGSEIRLHELLEDEDKNSDELQVISSLIDEIRYNSCITLPLQILRKPDRKNIGSIDAQTFIAHLVDDVPLSVLSTESKDRKKARKSDPFKMSYTDFLVFNHSAVRKKYLRH